jgi:CubicO group peptidase (beta-lactamase class C family)
LLGRRLVVAAEPGRQLGGREVMPTTDELDFHALVGGILNRRPAVGLAMGVVRHGGLEFFHGHGVADIASGTPVTEDTVFRIGSITKTFTAIAVLQLCESGSIDLDAPAGDYLRAYRLIPAKATHRPATVRHLLTHTAGLPEVAHPWRLLEPVFGEMVPFGQPVPSLAEYYGGALRLAVEPGTRYTYSDHAFATLGQIVADVSGTPFDAYLRDRVFDPLGMTHSDLVRSDRVGAQLATGFELRARGPRPVTDRDLVTAGGGGIYSTPADMARYLTALLAGGTNEHGSVLMPETLATMYAPQYQPDPRVPGVGLAFNRVDIGGHHAVEHGGIVPGFNSQIFAAVEDGVAVMAFTNGARSAMLWLPGETAALLAHLLGASEDRVRDDVGHRPEVWADLCGWYQLPALLTDVRARLTLGAGVEVFVRRGRLMIRGLSPIPSVYRGFPLIPDDDTDPYVFRIDLSEFGIGTARVVFTREPGMGTTSAHLDFFPPTLRKRPAVTNPRHQILGALGAVAVAGGATALERRRHHVRRAMT